MALNARSFVTALLTGVAAAVLLFPFLTGFSVFGRPTWWLLLATFLGLVALVTAGACIDGREATATARASGRRFPTGSTTAGTSSPVGCREVNKRTRFGRFRSVPSESNVREAGLPKQSPL